MNLKIMSYNLRQGAAFGELPELVEMHQPDIVCLQECTELLPNIINNMALLGSAPLGTVSQAMYYKRNKFKILGHQNHSLQQALYEKALGDREARLRLMVASFEDIKTSAQVCVAGFHASHLLASNRNRRKQIGQAIGLVGAAGLPAVLMGDFNYPWFRVGLEREVLAQDFTLAKPKNATLRNRLFSGWFDYAVHKDINLISIETQSFGASDHAPVIAKFRA